MRVLLADDHGVTRLGLKRLLTEAFGKVTFGEAGSAREALQAATRQAWDLVVLDINMPGRSGIDVLREIKRLKPRVPVLILSMYAEEEYAVRALRHGAAGYLTKDAVPEELARAVKKALAGGRYVSATLGETLARRLGAGGEELHEALSDRELEVLRRLGAGRTVRQIAEEMALSVKTISTYRARLLEKMKMRTTAELVRYAIVHRLAD